MDSHSVRAATAASGAACEYGHPSPLRQCPVLVKNLHRPVLAPSPGGGSASGAPAAASLRALRFRLGTSDSLCTVGAYRVYSVPARPCTLSPALLSETPPVPPLSGALLGALLAEADCCVAANTGRGRVPLPGGCDSSPLACPSAVGPCADPGTSAVAGHSCGSIPLLGH